MDAQARGSEDDYAPPLPAERRGTGRASVGRGKQLSRRARQPVSQSTILCPFFLIGGAFDTVNSLESGSLVAPQFSHAYTLSVSLAWPSSSFLYESPLSMAEVENVAAAIPEPVAAPVPKPDVSTRGVTGSLRSWKVTQPR